jgi:hypothetical protein
VQGLDDSDEDNGLQARPLVLVVVVLGMLLGTAGTAWATNWKPTLKAGSAGEARAQGAPPAPTGGTAACTSSTAQTAKVSWAAVTRANNYTVYEATTSATGTYTSVAIGITTTSWTSGTLIAANYWFEVAAYVGTNWLGTKSSATGESTISSSGCVQP